MLHDYSGPRLRSLRKRAMLTQMQVVQLTGICEATICNVEKGLRRPQTRTLEKMLNLYAIRINQINNINKAFEEKPSGGNLSTKATVRPGITRFNAIRDAKGT